MLRLDRGGQQPAMDDVKDARDAAVKNVRSARDQAGSALDDGLTAASQAAKQTIAFVRDNANQAKEEGQSYLDVGLDNFERTQDQALGKVKEGIAWVQLNDSVTIPVGATVLTLMLPGARRFLWRQTIGRFRSEEAMFRSAERSFAAVAESLEGHNSEGQKLLQRMAAAEEQYDTGLKKLVATAKQLSALQKRVRGTEKAAGALVRNLRELPSRDALALRAQVAAQVASASMQRSGLDRTLWNLSKKGVY